MSLCFQEHSKSLFEKRLESAPDWLAEIRKQAWQKFEAEGLPKYRKSEAWKYTNLAPLEKLSWSDRTSDPKALLENADLLPIGDCYRIVLLGDQLVSDLSELPKEVKFLDLAETEKESWDENLEGLMGLNTALNPGVLCVEIPENVSIEKPIHLVILAAGGNAHPRLWVRAGRNSRLQIYEQFVSSDKSGLMNFVSDIEVGEGACVERTKVAEGAAYLFEHNVARVQAKGNFISNFFGLGGELARDDISVHLQGRESRCELNGLFMAKGTEQIDSRTLIDHAAEHCESKEVYRGVLDGKATGVFDGRVFVQKGAQKTLSEQSNKNLLLSDDALINTKPQLEIYADDVKCAHGATSGQLDKDALFYLRSRGLDLNEAKSVLTYAFAAELMAELQNEDLKSYLRHRVMNWLGEDFE